MSATGSAIPKSALQPIVDLIRQLAADAYWGDLTLRFQRGEIVHLLKTESLKPEALASKQPEYRKAHDQSSQ